MSTSQSAAAPASDIEMLIKAIFDSEAVVCTIAAGDNLSIAELMGKNAPSFQGGWWSVETDAWHIHAQLSAIRKVRFVREPNPHGAGEVTLSIQFLGPSGESLLCSYFTQLYDDQKQPIAARFGRWEELRRSFGDQDEVEFETAPSRRARSRAAVFPCDQSSQRQPTDGSERWVPTRISRAGCFIVRARARAVWTANRGGILRVGADKDPTAASPAACGRAASSAVAEERENNGRKTLLRQGAPICRG